MATIAENKSKNIEYLRRSSQMVQSFGPGSMVDFKEQTLMPAAPHFWEDRIYQIYDRRLQKRLGVNYFGLPINKFAGNDTKGLAYVRFPEWYYCKVCHKFQSLKDWIKEYQASEFYKRKKEKNPNFTDANMVSYLRCYKGSHKKPADLVCVRFVSVCNCGHIDDFPWMEYVHKKYYAKTHNNSIDGYNYNIKKDGFDGNIKHNLSMNSLRMSGPEGIQITCDCGATANMTGAFKDDALKKLKIECTGRHPWKFQYQKGCKGKLQAIIRGSSSVYFPITINSIVIPQTAEEHYREIVGTELYKEFWAIVEREISKANQQTSVINYDAQNKILNDSLQKNESDIKSEESLLHGYEEGLSLPVPDSLKNTLLNSIQKSQKIIQKLKKENEEIQKQIEELKSKNTNNSEEETQIIPDLTDVYSEYSKKISDITQIPENEIYTILEESVEIKPTSETDDFSYKEYEYKALSGETKIKNSKYFTRVSNADNPFFRYQNNGILNFIKNVSLIKNLREVQALLGYSRLKPFSFSDSVLSDKKNSITDPDNTKMVFIKDYTDKWYPGSEVIGEGIFIEFDYKMISEWAKKDLIRSRVGEINKRFKTSMYGKDSNRLITPGFILLHTCAHLLLNQLSFECGYNVASLKERIYFSDLNKRSGILIYTANGDSEGSLGGLVRQGMFDVFPSILAKAMDSAKYCSNDPVCSCSRGQGRDALNLAACHSCVLLPETCCEEFNGFLDRGLLVGTLDSEDFGFLMHCEAYPKNQVIKKEFAQLKIIEAGSDLSDINYSEIWEDIFNEDEGFDEKFESEIKIRISEFDLKEKPMKDVKIKIGNIDKTYTCNIVWLQSKVIYIGACNTDYKNIIDTNTDTGWTYFSGEKVNIDDLLAKLEEK